MSQRAIDILNRWVAEAVRPVPAERMEKEAIRLAAEFTAYAEDAGLRIENLEVDVGEDIVSYMKDALTEAADAQAEGPLGEQE